MPRSISLQRELNTARLSFELKSPASEQSATDDSNSGDHSHAEQRR
ncbi:MAG: hypothetical protein HOB29_00450 [Planctomycetaceae bacterium]|nr:hypothetical protein [Planctomycetaceae bacterium]